ncbi:MAG: hypothetical protein ACREU2_06745 [Steroidobacteraceae bacterium]
MGASFLVPLALTALSAGGEYVNQSQAQGAQNAAQVAALNNQQAIQSKAAGAVGQLVDQVARNGPQNIQQAATADYVNQLRKNAAGSMEGGSTNGAPTNYGQSTSAVGATAGADPRFKAQLANDQTQVQDYGDQYAKELGSMDAAVRQRQLEGLGMQSLQTELDTLGAQSYAQNFVDSLRANAAGAQNPWLALASSTLGKGAQTAATNWPAKKPVGPVMVPNSDGYTDTFNFQG